MKQLITKYLIILNIISFNIVYTQLIDIDISSNKESFFVGEPTYVDIVLTNNSPDSLYVNETHFMRKMVLIDEKNNKYRKNTVVNLAPAHKHNVQPYDIFSSFHFISELFGIGDSVYSTPHLPVGNYTVYIENYKPSKPIPLYGRYNYLSDVYDHYYSSNILHFTVIEPTYIDKFVLNKINQALGYKKEKKREKAFNLLENLISENPNSIYAPIILRHSSLIHRLSDDFKLRRKSLDAAKRLLLEYPDSYLVRVVYGGLFQEYRTMKDRAGLIELFEKIIQINPNSIAAKIAEKKLEWVKTASEDDFDPEKQLERDRARIREMLDRHN